jgi:hypothetical protein
VSEPWLVAGALRPRKLLENLEELFDEMCPPAKPAPVEDSEEPSEDET